MLVQWSLTPSLQTHLQEVKSTGLFLVSLYPSRVCGFASSGRAVNGHASGFRGPFRLEWLCLPWRPSWLGCGGPSRLSCHCCSRGQGDWPQFSFPWREGLSGWRTAKWRQGATIFRLNAAPASGLARTSAGLGVRRNGLSVAVCFWVTVITQKICMFSFLSLQMTLSKVTRHPDF